MTTLIAYALGRVRRRNLPNLRDSFGAYGHCHTETSALLRAYNASGDVYPQAHAIRVTGVNFPGREHWAVVEFSEFSDPADAMVVDVTARQFDASAPVPWTGTLTDWYDAAVDWLGDHLNVEVYAPDPHDSHGIAHEPLWRDRYDSRDDVTITTEPMRAWSS